VQKVQDAQIVFLYFNVHTSKSDEPAATAGKSYLTTIRTWRC